LSIASYIQLTAFILATPFTDNFLLVIGNYAPILFFFFIMNLLNLKKGKREQYFSLFFLIMALGTIVQITKISASDLINNSTLFHTIVLIGYIILYFGIQQKKSSNR
jgi:quinol-cytochrome oxidoreductase complex cytochrome b subunit